MGLFSHASKRSGRLVAGLLASLLLVLVAGPAGVADAAVTGRTRIDLRVLVLDDGSNPGLTALVAEMDREGVPYTELPITTPITAPTADDAGLLEGPTGEDPHAKYQAVVLPNAAPGAIDATEMATLATYERTYGVRQVDAFLFPDATVGLVNQDSGPLDGLTATVTPEGLAGPFDYLKGSVPIADVDPRVDESFGYFAVPSALTAGQSFEPLLTTTSSKGSDAPLVGVFTDDGREQLVVTGAYNEDQQWFQTIGHGILTWATRGIHLGYDRNYFSMHVDDVFLPDSRWSASAHCTPGDDFCPTGTTTPDIRMTAADVAKLVAWQNANNLKLDMVFNGGGSKAWTTANGSDPLAAAFTATGTVNQFQWINHTFTHPFLGCLQVPPAVAGDAWRCLTTADPAGTPTQDDELTGTAGPDGKLYVGTDLLTTQVQDNIDWATAHNLTGYFDPKELVTGEHSGLRTEPQQPLDNPFLGPVLKTLGITWTASDASRETASRFVEGDGSTTQTVPRHPMNIFYNAGTYQDEVSEYNWIYTSEADGGSGICTANPDTSTCITPLAATDDVSAKSSFDTYIKPLETRIALSHVLTNDPRPHYAHQSNLAEDGILYPVLERLVADYRAAFANNTPIVQPTQTQAGEALVRSAAWTPVSKDVTAYLDADGVHVPDSAVSDVPVTVPTTSTGAALDAYAGEQSGWLSDSATIKVPDVGYGPAVIPSAPTDVVGVAGDSTVALSWTAAAVASGGTAVSSYTITPVKDGVALPVIRTGTDAITAKIDGLTNGATYTFTVVARNVSGFSAPSTASAPVTPLAPVVTPTPTPTSTPTTPPPVDVPVTPSGTTPPTTTPPTTTPPTTTPPTTTPPTTAPASLPGAVLRQPASSVVLAPTMTVRWTATGGTAAGYRVYVKQAAFGKTLPGTWRYLRTVTGTSTSIRFSMGQTVAVAVRGVGQNGRLGALSAPTRAVAYPKRLAGGGTVTGWTYLRRASLAQSPAVQSARRGATVRMGRVVKASSIALLATGSRTSGVVDVYVGGTRSWTLDLRKGAHRTNQVFLSKRVTPRTGTLVLRVRSSGKVLRLQGIAVLR